MNTAVAERQEQAQPSTALTPMEMLDRAVSNGASVETLTQLMALQERWEKNQARRAYDQAMAAAKAEMPILIKSKVVDFTSSKGRTHYTYADLAEVNRTVDPILAKHGLFTRYRTTTNEGEILVTCIVNHEMGHSEETSLPGKPDMSGNKNPTQAVGSTVTYLQRYTKLVALGLAAEEDDDGRAAGGGNGGTIDADQAETLKRKMVEAGADMDKFFAHFHIESKKMEDLPASQYDKAYRMLTQKAARSAATKEGGDANTPAPHSDKTQPQPSEAGAKDGELL